MANPRPKVILLGWDAADWQIIEPLINAGLMPTLKQFIDDGASGNVSTMQPVLSPMLWNNIATGKVPAKHGILNFVEPKPDGSGIQTVTSTSRKTKAIWNIASQNGLKSIVVGWFASHPAEPVDGVIVSDQFITSVLRNLPDAELPPASVHPSSLAARLRPQLVFPGDITRREILPFVPQSDSIPESQRQLLAKIQRLLATCNTAHNIFIDLLKTEPTDFAAAYFQTIDHFCHSFMPFHPPHMPHVPREQFELYQNCINAIYRHHDAMLRDVLEAADSDATVIILSDHGFVSDHLRPRTMNTEENPPAWHRAHGIIAARGPGISKGRKLQSACIIDATPTILTMLGLPAAADMDGKVLLDLFAARPQVPVIASWDAVEGPRSPGMHPPNLRVDPYEQAESLKQLIELGYIGDPGADATKAITNVKIEGGLNLAWSELVHHPAHAMQIVDSLYAEHAADPRVLTMKLQLQIAAKRFTQAAATFGPNGGNFDYLKPEDRCSLGATIAIGRRDYDSALRSLREIENINPAYPLLQLQFGLVHCRRRDWPAALASYAAALQLDPSLADAHRGRGYAFLRLGEYSQAASEFLTAIELLHDLPAAHLQLGLALLHLNLPQQAAQSLVLALRLNPGLVSAHRLLALACARLGHDKQAQIHRQATRRLLQPATSTDNIPAPV